MPEEPEAELQASAANLSPVSPSPVHTASPLVVPALQDTVDTLDAMVAAATASNGHVAAFDSNGAQTIDHIQPSATQGVDIVDDDDDPYEDEDMVEPSAAAEPSSERSENGNDDYAKAFDSDPEEGEGENPTTSETPKPSAPGAAQGEASHCVPDPSPAQHDTAAPPASQPIAEPGRSASHPYIEAAEGARTSGEPQAQPPIDISQLVASLTAHYSGPAKLQSPSVEHPHQTNQHPAVLPSSTSLPPRPPQPDVQPQAHPAQHHPAGSNPSYPSSNTGAPPPTSSQTPAAAGYPAQTNNNYAPPTDVQPSYQTHDQPTYSAPSSAPSYGTQGTNQHYSWEQFNADERQYMSEAKWDRFPEGSRIFIGTRSASGAAKDGAHIFSTGNLSSDKVSRRDVFDMFSSYGRLAQISLKSAYGFVQYHTPDEGQRAIDSLEGAEVKGRRIHLEVSKLQDKSKKDRQRSPDHNRRDGGRFKERFGNQKNADYRDRDSTPPRNAYSNDHKRNPSYNDYGRGGRSRSRSPGYGRNGRDNYRRRSPSPYGHQQHQAPELDLPKRYGADVPDVQLILQDDLNRDFVSWVEGAFKFKGLRTNTMFLHPRMPKDQVIQRQAAEGVHGVVDLDMRAQNMSKIPIQAFDRSGGSQNIRFDQYQDLDPVIAAEVIARTKATSVPASYGQPPQQGTPAGYAQGYGAHQPPPYHQQPPQHPQPSPNAYYPPQQHAYPPHQPPPQQAPPQQASASQPDLAAVLSQVDPNTLQQILSAAGHSQQQPQAGAPKPDLQAILGNLAAGAPQQQPPHGQYAATYNGQHPGLGSGGDSAAEVQNIMANLARYRQ